MDDDFEPLSMIEGAIGMHELYLAYKKAGFTEEQAMKLLCAMVTPKDAQ